MFTLRIAGKALLSDVTMQLKIAGPVLLPDPASPLHSLALSMCTVVPTGGGKSKATPPPQTTANKCTNKPARKQTDTSMICWMRMYLWWSL